MSWQPAITDDRLAFFEQGMDAPWRGSHVMVMKMPPFDVSPLPPATQGMIRPRQGADATPESSDTAKAPEHPVTGKVFALKDGSGYAVQGSDGTYYRLQANGSGGVVTTVTAGYVDASLVDVAGGSVNRLRMQASRNPVSEAARSDTEAEEHIEDKTAGTDTADPAVEANRDTEASDPPLPPLVGAPEAADAARQATALIVDHPEQALASQRGTVATKALSLLL